MYESQAERKKSLAAVEVFEATGCGHGELFECFRSASTSGNSRSTTGVSCTAYIKPAP